MTAHRCDSGRQVAHFEPTQPQSISSVNHELVASQMMVITEHNLLLVVMIQLGRRLEVEQITQQDTRQPRLDITTAQGKALFNTVTLRFIVSYRDSQ